MQTQTQDYRKVAEAPLARDRGMLIGGTVVPAMDGATRTDTAPSDGRFLAKVPAKSVGPFRDWLTQVEPVMAKTSAIDVDHGEKADSRIASGA